jgi:5'-deoxynucleotidase YfbR-like HD superfamily hydrolase
MSWIQTHTNKKFDLANPTPDMFDIEDIAHALSNICRYTGHVSTFYSVAQHCFLAYTLIDPKYRRDALLHDLSEAYLNDIASPLKALIPAYGILETRIMNIAAQRFTFTFPLPHQVHEIDLRLLQTERLQLFGKEPEAWSVVAEPFDTKINCWTPEEAYFYFKTACDIENII